MWRKARFSDFLAGAQLGAHYQLSEGLLVVCSGVTSALVSMSLLCYPIRDCLVPGLVRALEDVNRRLQQTNFSLLFRPNKSSSTATVMSPRRCHPET